MERATHRDAVFAISASATTEGRAGETDGAGRGGGSVGADSMRRASVASSLGGTGYLCSAKTGDQVAQAFFRIAADVAGVAVSRPDVQVRAKAITAHVISHKAGDGGEAPSATEQAAEREADGKGRRCAVM